MPRFLYLQPFVCLSKFIQFPLRPIQILQKKVIPAYCLSYISYVYAACGPKIVHIYIDRPSLDFSEATSTPAIQTLSLTEEDLSGKPIPLRFVKFQNVHSVQLFIEDNQDDEDITFLNRISFIGATLEGLICNLLSSLFLIWSKCRNEYEGFERSDCWSRSLNCTVITFIFTPSEWSLRLFRLKILYSRIALWFDGFYRYCAWQTKAHGEKSSCRFRNLCWMKFNWAVQSKWAIFLCPWKK